MKNFQLFLSLVVLVSLLATLSSAKEEATGFIYVKQIDGVWWFVDPDGEKFVSNGVNHIEPHLWLAPYNKEATLKKYGADMVDDHGHFNTHGRAAQKWIDQQVETTKSLHFNTFARHTHPTIHTDLYKNQIYYVASLQTGPLAGWRERNGEGPRPDVFSADFREFLENRVKEVCEEHKDSRNLLGYMYTDVPSWVVQSNRNVENASIYPWLNAIFPLGEASPGKWKWVEHLQSRYESPLDVAKVWGLSTSPTYGISWYKMLRLNTWFNPTDAAKADEDMRSFMYLVAEQWYRIHYDLIRKYDPNHLILGDKNWITWHYPWVLSALEKYVDVVAIQAYGRWSEDSPVIEEIFAATGKPIFNGYGCYGFAGPNQQEYGVKGWRTQAKNLGEVADFYKETMESMMRTPYIVGWHHCGFLEQWDASERGDSPRNENGFMDPFENFHEEFVDVVRKVNARAVRLHEKAE